MIQFLLRKTSIFNHHGIKSFPKQLLGPPIHRGLGKSQFDLRNELGIYGSELRCLLLLLRHIEPDDYNEMAGMNRQGTGACRWICVPA